MPHGVKVVFMSERKQHNSHLTGLKMQSDYGDETPHKHNKYHLTYRKHFRSHPIETQIHELDHGKLSNLERSTGHIRQGNLKKIRTKIQRHHDIRQH